MEIDLTSFLKDWKLALFGTVAQIVLSILSVYCVGYFLEWSTARILVLGCVIALSSSAVVFKLLEEKQLFKTKLGKNVSCILLAQDIAIAPILIVISLIGVSAADSASAGADSTVMKILGGLVFIFIIAGVTIKKEIAWLPFKKEDFI